MANFIIYVLAATLLISLGANFWEGLAMGLLLLAANINGALMGKQERDKIDDSM